MSASLLVLALAMLALPSSTQRMSPDRVQDALRQVPFSHSPAEAELPPLDIAVRRLASESAEAACWALRLHPEGAGCAEGAAGD